MGDGRKVAITFISQENDTKVIEAFEAETACHNVSNNICPTVYY
jgi:hypothetical protein